MKKLVLIDGHAILHRAYHALPPNFTAPDGTATNAVYGFMTMLLRVLSDLKPIHLAKKTWGDFPSFCSAEYF